MLLYNSKHLRMCGISQCATALYLVIWRKNYYPISVAVLFSCLYSHFFGIFGTHTAKAVVLVFTHMTCSSPALRWWRQSMLTHQTSRTVLTPDRCLPASARYAASNKCLMGASFGDIPHPASCIPCILCVKKMTQMSAMNKSRHSQLS